MLCGCRTREPPTRKADVAEHAYVLCHVGLLSNEPSGIARIAPSLVIRQRPPKAISISPPRQLYLRKSSTHRRPAAPDHAICSWGATPVLNRPVVIFATFLVPPRRIRADPATGEALGPRKGAARWSAKSSTRSSATSKHDEFGQLTHHGAPPPLSSTSGKDSSAISRATAVQGGPPASRGWWHGVCTALERGGRWA